MSILAAFRLISIISALFVSSLETKYIINSQGIQGSIVEDFYSPFCGNSG